MTCDSRWEADTVAGEEREHLHRTCGSSAFQLLETGIGDEDIEHLWLHLSDIDTDLLP